jgi:hypothetical protein
MIATDRSLLSDMETFQLIRTSFVCYVVSPMHTKSFFRLPMVLPERCSPSSLGYECTFKSIYKNSEHIVYLHLLVQVVQY